MIHDTIQKVIVDINVEIKICFFNKSNGAYDTKDMYSLKNVSYGAGKLITLDDGTNVKFVNNILKTDIQIDERNLTHC